MADIEDASKRKGPLCAKDGCGYEFLVSIEDALSPNNQRQCPKCRTKQTVEGAGKLNINGEWTVTVLWMAQISPGQSDGISAWYNLGKKKEV
jgi:hypothetical protein